MQRPVSSLSDVHLSRSKDEWVFGWNPTPGIVSVWADRSGKALLWRREGQRVTCSTERFRPWLVATTLEDLAHLHSPVLPTFTAGSVQPDITYRELDGPEGSYRYLLSAHDGRQLERTLVDGASRRLGREVKRVSELPETYYVVGPVEQFLMLKGMVSFRGLAYDDLYRLIFDLETTALDPQRGRIFLVAIHDSTGFETILEAATPEQEARLITDLCALIRERDPDVIENYNLCGFDLPFLQYRATTLNVPLHLGRAGSPPLLASYEEAGSASPYRFRQRRFTIAGREVIDTLEAVQRYDFAARVLPSYRLKEVAKHFGLAAPDRVYLEGSKIYETYREHPDLVRHYALDDVREVDGLSRRLMGAAFALAGMAPRCYGRVAAAGPAMGILEPLLVRAYLRKGTALPQPLPPDASWQHEGGATYLLAEGVAEHVVKADVASLYPSLMRIYQIGPKSDALGMLLHFLDRLTTLRLFHKTAARQAPPGSMVANQHEGTQAAMKTLINAADGYRGAGSMALFADPEAADTVTRRGRELLDRLLAALQERGMVPIEADTDGVYFAVPADWTEREERALVAQIGAQLPAGIRLEYEGRYRAMLSHAIKNYALLTYDGELIVRGGALRSSRSEPFGERFLRQALLSLMQGDIAGVERCFLGTLEALRQRKLPASDVASRVRLSKSPQAYLASRKTHSEGQYEALLAAGRKQWSVGERVRTYRTQSGAYRWLPEEREEAPLSLEEQENGEGLDTENVLVPTETASMDEQRDYDVEQYARLLLNSYASRLAVAFTVEDFQQLFRVDGQMSLFDRPLEAMQLRWIRCPAPASSSSLREHEVEGKSHHSSRPATSPNEKGAV
jgi:DNA polymerase, archaea type